MSDNTSAKALSKRQRRRWQESGPPEHRPHATVTYAGGDDRNPYLALIIRWMAWVSMIGLPIVIALRPPSVSGSTPASYFACSVFFGAIGWHSAMQRAWPASIVLWLLAFSALVGVFR